MTGSLDRRITVHPRESRTAPPEAEAELGASTLPGSVRYVKLGAGGRWWKAAKERGQIHFGWMAVPDEALLAADYDVIERTIRDEYGGKPGATQDFRAVRSVLDQPSRHVWVAYQDGSLWWCTVLDGIAVNPAGESLELGHFWLTCDRPWTDRSLQGRRLALSELPGIVGATSGFQGTACTPGGWKEILRILTDAEDPAVMAAAQARGAYETAVSTLIARLMPKDFELLVDLILSRTGWSRLEKLGGSTEGVDVEVENPALDEVAFVQVKSRADQTVLDDYVGRFVDRRERYARMIFAVHSPKKDLVPPADLPVQVWDGPRIARLVVRLGLGDWVANRV